MIIFIIGPGGVGKSTSGKILAEKLKFNLIDLDLVFCEQIKIVGTYIQDKGYKSYCEENSKLFYQLLENINCDTVFILSSGFLIHEGLAEKHHETLKERGISILLLPSNSIEESANIVVERQLQRGFGLQKESERQKFIDRYPKYLGKGDITIFSTDNPQEIANHMKEELFITYLNNKE